MINPLLQPQTDVQPVPHGPDDQATPGIPPPPPPQTPPQQAPQNPLEERWKAQQSQPQQAQAPQNPLEARYQQQQQAASQAQYAPLAPKFTKWYGGQPNVSVSPDKAASALQKADVALSLGHSHDTITPILTKALTDTRPDAPDYFAALQNPKGVTNQQFAKYGFDKDTNDKLAAVADCSKFTQNWFKQNAGVDIPRTAIQQYNATAKVQTQGKPDYSKLQPGDLVFFDNGLRTPYNIDGKAVTGGGPFGDQVHGYINHVGIYKGNGVFVADNGNGVYAEHNLNDYLKIKVKGAVKPITFMGATRPANFGSNGTSMGIDRFTQPLPTISGKAEPQPKSSDISIAPKPIYDLPKDQQGLGVVGLDKPTVGSSAQDFADKIAQRQGKTTFTEDEVAHAKYASLQGRPTQKDKDVLQWAKFDQGQRAITNAKNDLLHNPDPSPDSLRTLGLDANSQIESQNESIGNLFEWGYKNASIIGSVASQAGTPVPHPEWASTIGKNAAGFINPGSVAKFATNFAEHPIATGQGLADSIENIFDPNATADERIAGLMTGAAVFLGARGHIADLWKKGETAAAAASMAKNSNISQISAYRILSALDKATSGKMDFSNVDFDALNRSTGGALEQYRRTGEAPPVGAIKITETVPGQKFTPTGNLGNPGKPDLASLTAGDTFVTRPPTGAPEPNAINRPTGLVDAKGNPIIRPQQPAGLLDQYGNPTSAQQPVQTSPPHPEVAPPVAEPVRATQGPETTIPEQPPVTQPQVTPPQAATPPVEPPATPEAPRNTIEVNGRRFSLSGPALDRYNEIQNNYNATLEYIKRNTKDNPEGAAARKKAAGLRRSAELRELTGARTPTEEGSIKADAATLNAGTPVDTPDGPGTVTRIPAFGKVKVRVEGLGEKSYETYDVTSTQEPDLSPSHEGVEEISTPKKTPEQQAFSNAVERFNPAPKSPLPLIEGTAGEPGAPQPQSAPPQTLESAPVNPIKPSDEALDNYHKTMDRFKANGGFGGLGVNGGTALSDLIEAGTYLLEAGVKKFGEWSKAMVEKAGEAITPHLKEIWEQAHAPKPTKNAPDVPSAEHWGALVDIGKEVKGDNPTKQAWKRAMLQGFGGDAGVVEPHLDRIWDAIDTGEENATQQVGQQEVSGTEHQNGASGGEEEVPGNSNSTVGPETSQEEGVSPKKALNPEATGLARVFDDMERYAQGKAPIPTRPISVEELAARGEHLIKSGQADPEKILANNRALSPNQVAVMTVFKRDLVNRLNDLADKLGENPDPVTGAGVSAEISSIYAKLDQISEVAEKTRGYWHQLGMALQLAFNPDYSIEYMNDRGLKLNGNEPLSDSAKQNLNEAAEAVRIAKDNLSAESRAIDKMLSGGKISETGMYRIVKQSTPEELVRLIKGLHAQETIPKGVLSSENLNVRGRGTQSGAIGLAPKPKDVPRMLNQAVRRLAVEYRKAGADSIDKIMTQFAKDLPYLTKDDIYDILDGKHASRRIELTAAQLEARDALASIKRAADIRRLGTLKKFAIGAAGAIDSLTRTPKLIGHATGLGVQGRNVLFTNPKAWANSVFDMGRGWFGKKGFEATNRLTREAEIIGGYKGGAKAEYAQRARFMNTPSWGDAKASGMDQVLARPHGSSYEMEEENLRRAVFKAITDKAGAPGRALGKLSEGSSAAFNMTMNSMRWDLFEAARKDAAKLVEQGKLKPSERMDYLQDRVRDIATTTGRSVSKLAKASANISGSVFAPRFTVSKWEYGWKPFMEAKTPQAKAAIAKRVALAAVGKLAVASTAVALMRAANVDVDLDVNPRSAQFGHIVGKNWSFDILGPSVEPIKFLAQFFGGRINTVGKESRGVGNAAEVLYNYVAGKLVPANQFAADAAFGQRTEEGGRSTPLINWDKVLMRQPKPPTKADILREKFSPTKAIANLSEPIFLQSTLETTSGKKGLPSTAVFPPTAIGFNLRPTPPKNPRGAPRKKVGGIFKY